MLRQPTARKVRARQCGAAEEGHLLAGTDRVCREQVREQMVAAHLFGGDTELLRPPA